MLGGKGAVRALGAKTRHDTIVISGHLRVVRRSVRVSVAFYVGSGRYPTLPDRETAFCTVGAFPPLLSTITLTRLRTIQVGFTQISHDGPIRARALSSRRIVPATSDATPADMLSRLPVMEPIGNRLASRAAVHEHLRRGRT